MKNFTLRQENDRLNMVAAFASGSLLGASLALLLAPRSGKETRRSLIRMGRTAQKNVRHFQSDLNKRMDHLLTEMLDDLRACLDDGKAWTEEKRTQIEQAFNTGKRNIERELERILHS